MPQTFTQQKFLIPLILLISGLLIFVLILTKPQPKAMLKQAIKPVVETVEAQTRLVKPVERVTGRLVPARRSTLSFEVDGLVTQQLCEAGDLMQKDQVLLQLDDADYRDSLLEAQAQLGQEKAAIKRDRSLLELSRENVQLAANEVKRLKSLGKKSLASQSALDDARQRLAQLKAERANLVYSVETAQQRLAKRQSVLDRAQRNLERTRLLAPFDGRVNKLFIEVGDRITPAAPALEFIDDSHFELRVKVSRQAIESIQKDLTMQVLLDDRRMQGQVVEFQRDPDTETFTYEVSLSLDGNGLVSGSLATVEVPLKGNDQALVVPQSAILNDNGNTFVFTVIDSVLHKRTVKTGLRHDGQQVIEDGLQPGDLVVARDVAALSDQQQVSLR